MTMLKKINDSTVFSCRIDKSLKDVVDKKIKELKKQGYKVTQKSIVEAAFIKFATKSFYDLNKADDYDSKN